VTRIRRIASYPSWVPSRGAGYYRRGTLTPTSARVPLWYPTNQQWVAGTGLAIRLIEKVRPRYPHHPRENRRVRRDSTTGNPYKDSRQQNWSRSSKYSLGRPGSGRRAHQQNGNFVAGLCDVGASAQHPSPPRPRGNHSNNSICSQRHSGLVDQLSLAVGDRRADIAASAAYWTSTGQQPGFPVRFSVGRVVSDPRSVPEVCCRLLRVAR